MKSVGPWLCPGVTQTFSFLLPELGKERVKVALARLILLLRKAQLCLSPFSRVIPFAEEPPTLLASPEMNAEALSVQEEKEERRERKALGGETKAVLITGMVQKKQARLAALGGRQQKYDRLKEIFMSTFVKQINE